MNLSAIAIQRPVFTVMVTLALMVFGFLGLSRYSNVYLKLTPLNVEPKDWGKATPETFYSALMKAYGANRIAWGSNFPATEGTLKEILGKAQRAWSFANASDRDWVFGKTALELYPSLK